jgi:hypothetical protein
VSSGIAQGFAKTGRTPLTTLSLLPSGSLLKDELYLVASQSVAAPMADYWWVPRSRNAQICSGLPFAWGHCSTWPGITYSISLLDGPVNMDQRKTNRIANTC